jgi:hypothetical protein
MAGSSIKVPFSAALIAFISLSSVDGFLPQAFVKSALKTPQQLAPMGTTSTSSHAALNLFDPASAMSMMDAIDTTSASALMDSASSMMDSASSMFSSSDFLSFTDQGQNLAGIFFQASLLPYLIFLYFLSFRANRISDLGNFGFQFLLIFVLSTIPSGIVTKAVYGLSLANTDWLHGGAETLLTVANILVVRYMHHVPSITAMTATVTVPSLSCFKICCTWIFYLVSHIFHSLLFRINNRYSDSNKP